MLVFESMLMAEQVFKQIHVKSGWKILLFQCFADISSGSLESVLCVHVS